MMVHLLTSVTLILDFRIQKNLGVCSALKLGNGESYAHPDESIRYGSIITIANFVQLLWGFPLSLMIALADIHPVILASSKIHVNSISWATNWLLPMGLNVTNTVSGTIITDTLYVPETTLDEFASGSQLNWLRRIISKMRKDNGGQSC